MSELISKTGDGNDLRSFLSLRYILELLGKNIRVRKNIAKHSELKSYFFRPAFCPRQCTQPPGERDMLTEVGGSKLASPC